MARRCESEPGHEHLTRGRRDWQGISWAITTPSGELRLDQLH